MRGGKETKIRGVRKGKKSPPSPFILVCDTNATLRASEGRVLACIGVDLGDDKKGLPKGNIYDISMRITNLFDGMRA